MIITRKEFHKAKLALYGEKYSIASLKPELWEALVQGWAKSTHRTMTGWIEEELSKTEATPC